MPSTGFLHFPLTLFSVRNKIVGYKGIGLISGWNFSVDLEYSSLQIFLELQVFKSKLDTLNIVECMFTEQLFGKEWGKVGSLFSDTYQPNI